MPNSFNKGEWSEFYTFVKILADRKVHAADEDLGRIEDIFYPILKVIRKENNILKEYDISQKDSIKYKEIGSGKFIDIDGSKIKSSVQAVFEHIKSGKGASFEVPLSEGNTPIFRVAQK
jgi:hypothetical protein